VENNLDIFEQVHCLSMPRRNDRWERLQSDVQKCNWPFRPINRFEAVDGWKLPSVEGWGDGMRGAFACSQGHRRILEAAMVSGVHERNGAVLILEDDATFRPSFGEDFYKFYNALPDDWDFLFLGGQTNGNFSRINDEVRKIGWANRWHCYAVRGQLIPDLWKHLSQSKGHCDLVTWPFLAKYKVYGPNRWLSCQANSWSDISSNDNNWVRCFNDSPPDAVAVYLRSPRDVAEQLFELKILHPGFSRDNATGVDNFLQQKCQELSGPQLISAIHGFVNGLKGEALDYGNSTLACLWNPALPVTTARTACGPNVIEIEATTFDDALEKLLRGIDEKFVGDSSRRSVIASQISSH
jgi:GR25 family glycosyltransferase involved in LPS biosynthesis